MQLYTSRIKVFLFFDFLVVIELKFQKMQKLGTKHKVQLNTKKIKRWKLRDVSFIIIGDGLVIFQLKKIS